VVSCAISTGRLPPATVAQSSPAVGLDHIPVAVRDLARATSTYRALGFTLKPGRGHDDGIRNAHVKFPNGAGIELLTAPKAVDALSARYVEYLRAGEGPAFVSFHARDTERLHRVLRAGGYDFRQEGETTELLSRKFGFLFIVRDNRSPTDRPEHFVHANGATALQAVWIATPDSAALTRLLVALGGTQKRQRVLAPFVVDATVVTLDEGDVVILPEQRQILAGRPVIGAKFHVADLQRVRRTLAAAGIEPWTDAGSNERIVVDPSRTHGLWLEFSQ